MESVAVPDKPSRAFILTSRLVVGIITLLLLVIPWSERYSNLDSFPHDHDTELGILAIFAAFGLILLLLRAVERQLSNLLAVRYFLSLIIPWALSLKSHRHDGLTLTECHDPPPPASPFDRYSLPLQI